MDGFEKLENANLQNLSPQQQQQQQQQPNQLDIKTLTFQASCYFCRLVCWGCAHYHMDQSDNLELQTIHGILV